MKEHLSGLITRCGEVSAVSLEEADARLSDWLQTHFGSCSKPIHERPLLAGNSVHNDWLMVRRHLPKFHGGLHYRYWMFLLSKRCGKRGEKFFF